MITYIRYRLYKNNIREFVRDMKTALLGLHRYKNCTYCDLTECDSEKENFILRIEWNANVQGNLLESKAPEIITFLSAIRKHREFILEMRNYSIL